jgi:hypothetical protein
MKDKDMRKIYRPVYFVKKSKLAHDAKSKAKHIASKFGPVPRNR